MSRSASGKRKARNNPATPSTLVQRALRLAEDLSDLSRRGPMLSVLRELETALSNEVQVYFLPCRPSKNRYFCGCTFRPQFAVLTSFFHNMSFSLYDSTISKNATILFNVSHYQYSNSPCYFAARQFSIFKFFLFSYHTM